MPNPDDPIFTRLKDRKYLGPNMAVTKPLPGVTRVTLPAGGVSLMDIGAFLKECIAEPALGALLPDSFSGLASFNLSGLEVALADGQRRVSMDLIWDTTWTLVPDLIAIETPKASIGVIGPPSPAAGGIISGLLTIAGVGIDVSVAVPDLLLAGRLHSDSNGTLESLLDYFHLPIANPAGLQITDVLFNADPRAALYSFTISFTDSEWKPFGELKVTELGLNCSYSGGPAGQATGWMQGKVTLGGTDILLSAEHLGKDQGWQFSGSASGCNLRNVATELGTLLNVPLSSLPWLPSGAGFGLSFNTHTKHVTASFSGTSDGIRVALNANLLPSIAGGYDKRLDGKLILGSAEADSLEFDLTLDQTSQSQVLVGIYKNPGGGSLSLRTLLSELGTSVLPADVDPTFKVKDVLFVYQNKSQYVFALDMDAGLDLSGLGHLPLIGKLLPAEQSLQLAFQPILASSSAPDDAFRHLLPAGAPALPNPLTPGLSFATTLRIGDLTKTIDFGAAASGTKLDPKPTKLDAGMGSPQPPAATPPDPRAAMTATNVHWFDLQQHFGPLHLQRLGLSFENPKIDVLLDAALAVGPLEIALTGLGAEYNLDTHALTFRLDGLAIDFKRPPVELGAAFLQMGEDFVGKAVLRTETLVLQAFGAYGEHQGHPSLFIYAFADYPIGGPTFFFVEGLAAGFGYNRRLIVPPVGEIHQFPLVAEVIGQASRPAGLAGSDPTAAVAGIRTELEALERYVPAEIGTYFLAAGIKFSTFKLIDSFALLVVTLGQHLEVDLLGVSSLIVPTPEVGQSVEPLAEVQMAFSARFDPLEGFLGVQAQLTPNSFVLSRQCHLQGGYAFSAWMLGPYAGDFVYTAGGYHPAFHVPDRYPKVPRLGLNWKVSDHLSVKGGLYYALTPSAAMAGGDLTATWETGDVRATFEMGLNLLLRWKPFSYQADAYVEISASVTINFFGTHQLTVTAGADLEIWGPNFAGVAHVHVKVMHVSADFDVDFSRSRTGPTWLTWDQFQSSFLPKEPADWCSIALQDGLIRTDRTDGTESWIVNAKELVLATHSVVPAKDAYQETGTLAWNPSAALSLSGWQSDRFGIAPMGLDPDGFTTSTQGIRILRHGDGDAENRTDDFALLPIVKRFPAAMWGASHDPHAQLNAGMVSALAGFDIRPAIPAKPGETCLILREKLSYDIAPPRQLTPEDAAPVDYIAGQQAKLGDSLIDVETTARRAGLLQALEIDPLAAVDLSSALADCFVRPPAMVIALG